MASSSPRCDLRIDGPARASLTVVFAHGAGASMDHPFMTAVATGIAAGGFRVARFEFPYMAARRSDGRKRPPDREPALREAFRAAIEAAGARNVALAGKSMGARIAASLADEVGARGLLCFGYPFHAPGKPVGSRADALKTIRTPALILQGSRDAFGTRAEVSRYRLAPAVAVHYLEDGDHSLKPRKASGRSEAQNIAEANAEAVAFLKRIAR
jgi:predicted alpha/beta-hydrolase family hydrolase